jgi:hypothetical protein
MSYIDPITVDSPKGKVAGVKVLLNTGDQGWAAAEVIYEGERRLGLRWNGWEGERGIGNPQSRGHPTWFLLPGELEDVVRKEVDRLRAEEANSLAAGYRSMARDREREAEAVAWTEGMIGDGGNSEG